MLDEMTGAPHVLTSRERELLEVMEREIEHAENAGLWGARPYREIRNKRLYRETHQRWDDYTRERWGLSRHAINRRIKALEIVEELDAAGFAAPRTEKQARKLTRLTPEQRLQVALTLGTFRGVSARRVEEVAEAVAPRKGKALRKAATDLVLVTSGGRVGPSKTAKRRVLRAIAAMAAEVDAIQALGPHAVEDALRVAQTEEQAEAFHGAAKVARVIARVVAEYYRQHGEAPPQEGQQEFLIAA